MDDRRDLERLLSDRVCRLPPEEEVRGESIRGKGKSELWARTVRVNAVSDDDVIETYIPVVFVQNPGHLGDDEGRMAS